MKRILFILGLMCFLFDLIDIGFVDYAKHVAHEYPYASVHQQSFANLSKPFPREPAVMFSLPSYPVEANDRFNYLPVAEEIYHPIKTFYCYHFFSSGGIPS